MKLTKHYSLKHSDKVLKLVKQNLPKDGQSEIVVQAWSNGREQGYHLSHRIIGNRSYNVFGINFAQQRNSDSILVIYGSIKDFDIQTNHPYETIWKDRKEFSNDADAANFIIETLLAQTVDIQKVSV